MDSPGKVSNLNASSSYSFISCNVLKLYKLWLSFAATVEADVYLSVDSGVNLDTKNQWTVAPG